jgi:hypothetical protein
MRRLLRRCLAGGGSLFLAAAIAASTCPANAAEPAANPAANPLTIGANALNEGIDIIGCATKATLSLSKTGYTGVGSVTNGFATLVYGTKGQNAIRVFCLNATPQGAPAGRGGLIVLVSGPGALTPLYDAFYKNF